MQSPTRDAVVTQLISLFELMYEYAINDLVLMLTGLITASEKLGIANNPHEPIPDPPWLHDLSTTLDGLHVICGHIQLDSSLMDQIVRLKGSIRDGVCSLPATVLRDRIDTIVGCIQENLRSRKFMYVPQDQAEYWENIQLFGDDFLIGFPKAAVWEMREAGNCYAAGRWTASVFHSMRVAEHGLRRLAKRLRVTISSKGKNCPLEYGDWDTVITAIRNKIKALRQLPRGPRREASLQFYSEAADHCEYMKDIWRNEASHARRLYTKSESRAALRRVQEFVAPLAKTEADAVVRKRLRAAKMKSMGLTNLAALLGSEPKRLTLGQRIAGFGKPPVSEDT